MVRDEDSWSGIWEYTTAKLLEREGKMGKVVTGRLLFKNLYRRSKNVP